MTALYIPVGAPGCGKSTLAGRLIESGVLPSRDAVVEPDRYRLLLTGDVACQDANGAVFNICHTITQKRLRYGLDVYFDATNASWRALTDVLALAEGSAAAVTVIPLPVDVDTCLARNASRPQPVPEAVVRRMHRNATDVIGRLPELASRLAVATPEEVVAGGQGAAV